MTRTTAVTADLDPVHLQVPDSPVRLPEGHLACLACGVAVAEGPKVVTVETLGRADQPPAAPGGTPRGGPLSFVRCASCARIASEAEQIVDANPGLAARLGPDTARHRVECALLALEVIGKPAPPRVDLMLRHLSVPGAQVRWVARFVPLIEAGASPATCSPYRWAHVRLGARAQLRQAYGAMLAEMVAATAPDVRLAPPFPPFPQRAGEVFAIHGCLMCGVEAQTLPAQEVSRLGGHKAAASRVWEPKRASVGSLGGRASPDYLVGHLCAPCAAAVEHVGAMGPSAMERALTEHLRATGRGEEADRLSLGDVQGLIGWGALSHRAHRRGEKPLAGSRTPWEHVGLDHL
ncbi:hypothetical protein ASE25_07810 [Terrabacter sp. Root85]|uniref:hypothetical protein n=1 Tax=Terrabacter sp. Root85 TaxID=1736603 RepID=UPI0006F76CC8|nr:hypothetical protein [Terrabacter sp. Root85]KRC89493.1 hypothetical protein ASE25_07810 [Terrabacter sp. Root85]